VSIGHSVQLRSPAGAWRRWLRTATVEHPSEPASANAEARVASCPGCGLSVQLPEHAELDKCPACEAVLSIRADELDVELAVRSHLYNRD
jgi:predicted RNA-binding Zn-ribbon protein involved in translation (DUF1610 family)